MIQLNERLYAVIVPEEAKDFKVQVNPYAYGKRYQLEYDLSDTEGKYYDTEFVGLPSKLKILGTVTKDAIDFEQPYSFDFPDILNHDFDTWQSVFRSLLSIKGLFWEHDIEQPNPLDYLTDQFDFDYSKWCSAESKKLTNQKLVILERL